eukprot:Awhi_evm1s10551
METGKKEVIEDAPVLDAGGYVGIDTQINLSSDSGDWDDISNNVQSIHINYSCEYLENTATEEEEPHFTSLMLNEDEENGKEKIASDEGDPHYTTLKFNEDEESGVEEIVREEGKLHYTTLKFSEGEENGTEEITSC